MSNLVAKLDHLIKFATDLKAEVVAAERQHAMMEPDRRSVPQPVNAPTLNARDTQTVNRVAATPAPQGRQLPTGPLNPDLVKARQAETPQKEPSIVEKKKAAARAQAEEVTKGSKVLKKGGKEARV